MLDKQRTGLIVIDVQGKLAGMMHQPEALFQQLRTVIEGARLLDMPIIWFEQLPDKLGATRAEIADLLPGEPLIKHTFSGMANEEIATAIKNSGCDTWLVAGIESHICVYQTVCELIDSGYQVELVTDAVSSRTEANKNLAIRKMETLGVRMTSVEMALMELQRVAEGDGFRQLVKLIK